MRLNKINFGYISRNNYKTETGNKRCNVFSKILKSGY